MVRILTTLFNDIIDDREYNHIKRRYKEVKRLCPSFKFQDFSSPLILSCCCMTDLKFIRYLIKKEKVDINYQIQQDDDDGIIYTTNYNTSFIEGESALMILAFSKIGNKNRVLDIMMENGVDVNQINRYGSNALMYGIYYEDFDYCRRLIRYGSDINLKNEFGYTPLMIAYEMDKIHIFKMLIVEGADIMEFMEKRGDVRELLKVGISSLNSKKHEMREYIWRYLEDKRDFISNQFPGGIGDSLRNYIF